MESHYQRATKSLVNIFQHHVHVLGTVSHRKSQSSSTLFRSFCCHCDLKSISIKEMSSENCFEVFTDFTLVNALCYEVKT